MKISSIFTTAVILPLGGQVHAGVTIRAPKPKPPPLHEDVKANRLAKFLETARGVYPDTPKPWEYKKHPPMCSVKIQTKNGGNCKATSECSEGGKIEYNDWSACAYDRHQYFDDPRTGDLNITFVEVDGPGQGEGLTTPILGLKQFHNWLEIPVNGLAQEYEKNEDCNREDHQSTPGEDCGAGPFACHYDTFWLTIKGSKTKK